MWKEVAASILGRLWKNPFNTDMLVCNCVEPAHDVESVDWEKGTTGLFFSYKSTYSFIIYFLQLK